MPWFISTSPYNYISSFSFDHTDDSKTLLPSPAVSDGYHSIDQAEQLDDDQRHDVLSSPPSPLHHVHPTLIDGHSQTSSAPLPDRIFTQGPAWDPLPAAPSNGLPVYHPDPSAPSLPPPATDFNEIPSPNESIPDSNYDSLPDDMNDDDDDADMMGFVLFAILESTMASPGYQIYAARPTSARNLSRCLHRRATYAWTRTG